MLCRIKCYFGCELYSVMDTFAHFAPEKYRLFTDCSTISLKVNSSIMKKVVPLPFSNMELTWRKNMSDGFTKFTINLQHRFISKQNTDLQDISIMNYCKKIEAVNKLRLKAYLNHNRISGITSSHVTLIVLTSRKYYITNEVFN